MAISVLSGSSTQNIVSCQGSGVSSKHNFRQRWRSGVFVLCVYWRLHLCGVSKDPRISYPMRVKRFPFWGEIEQEKWLLSMFSITCCWCWDNWPCHFMHGWVTITATSSVYSATVIPKCVQPGVRKCEGVCDLRGGGKYRGWLGVLLEGVDK